MAENNSKMNVDLDTVNAALELTDKIADTLANIITAMREGQKEIKNAGWGDENFKKVTDFIEENALAELGAARLDVALNIHDNLKQIRKVLQEYEDFTIE